VPLSFQPGEVRVAVGIAGHDFTIEHRCLCRQLASSCAMEGNRSVKSCPLRLYMTTREPT
jgi:hypothetical protein